MDDSRNPDSTTKQLSEEKRSEFDYSLPWFQAIVAESEKLMDEGKKILPQGVSLMDMGVQSKHDEPEKNKRVDISPVQIRLNLELAFDLMMAYGVPDDKILLITRLITDAVINGLHIKLEEAKQKCFSKTNSPDPSSTA